MNNMREGNVIPDQSEDGPDVRPVTLVLPSRKPFVTIGFIVICVLVYIVQILSKIFLDMDVPIGFGAKYGPLIDMGQWWRLFTPIFIHGSIMHLVFNMYAMYSIGAELERFYGHVDFLFFVLISGYGGNVFSYAFSPETVSVGASTALFGMIAAEGFFIYKNRRIFSNAKRMLINVALVVVFNMVYGMTGGIDNWGHLGGLVAGATMAYVGCPTLSPQPNKDMTQIMLIDTSSGRTRYLIYIICFAAFTALAIAPFTD